MSNISVNTITDASGGSTASINGLTPQASNMQPFNRIINGAMTVDQRNAGAAVTPADTQYTLDRWVGRMYPNASKYTLQQNAGAVTPPVGFIKYLGVTSSSAYSVGAGDYYGIEQRIEGLNTGDLAWGTADAKTVTLSFWVRSSLTGGFGGNIRNLASDYSYPFAYSITSANTWEYKSVTIAGPTTGTWLTTNSIGLQVGFSLGTGSSGLGTADTWAGAFRGAPTGATSVVGTSGATFYITGVQLEAGSIASPFAHENYGDTLRKCQRYFQVYGNGVDNSFAYLQYSSTYRQINFTHSPLLRAAPTITQNYLAQYSAGIVYLNEFNICGLYLSMNYDNSAANYASKLTFDAEL